MKRAPVKPIQLKPDQIHDIQQAVFSLAEKQLDARYFLVDVAYEKEAGYWYLRLYVDLREGMISISECEEISRALEADIEALPQLADLAYNFEVSSPGVFRPLKTEREFAFYQGRPVRIAAKTEAKGGKKGAKSLTTDLPTVAEGVLKAYNAETQALTLTKAQEQKDFEVALTSGQLVYLNPVIHFPEEDEAVDTALTDDADEDDAL